MGQATNQIEAYIEDKRADLGSNLQELEHKVKAATDWKQHFRANPMTMVGVAFGGGIVLAAILGGSKRRSADRTYNGPGAPAGVGNSSSKALETWDGIKGALIGVAAARFRDVIGEIVPGFEEQFKKIEDNAEKAVRS